MQGTGNLGLCRNDYARREQRLPGRGQGFQPLLNTSLPSKSTSVAALYVTPPFNPAPCTSVDMKATTPDLISDKPARGHTPGEMLQQLLMWDAEWWRNDDHSALFLICGH